MWATYSKILTNHVGGKSVLINANVSLNSLFFPDLDLFTFLYKSLEIYSSESLWLSTNPTGIS